MAVGENEPRSRVNGAGYDAGRPSSANNRRSTRYYGQSQPNWERPSSSQTTASLTPAVPAKPERAESREKSSGGSERVCAACKKDISGHFVRALGASWHIECFRCKDCGNPCAKKFFQEPETEAALQSGASAAPAPLCERCYFKRLDLLCFRCDDALRGSYITALDRKYHIEHFTCSECPLVFGPDDSYYEHEGNVFCQYHYSQLHAAFCEGCQCAILKQFVETYRGGVESHWHPECYMIFKFWNVKLSSAIISEFDESEEHRLQPKTAAAVPTDEERARVSDHDKYIDSLVLAIWSTLCGFEETTASCISQMLQCAVNGAYDLALTTTSSLVGSVRVLFSAIEDLPLTATTPRLNKEPKTLCRKVVAYMSTVSKLRRDEMGSPDLLSVANSLAHYLKVLIRYGLSTALAIDRDNKNAKHPVLHSFLKQVSRFNSPPPPISVSALTSDRCAACEKTVEDNCICSRDRLWHIHCFKCVKSGDSLPDIPPHGSIVLKSSPVGDPLCGACAEQEEITVDAQYDNVGRLSQLMFLLYVAIARFELVLGQSDARDTKSVGSVSSPALAMPARPSDALLSPQLPSFKRGGSNENVGDKQYLSTVNEARNVRTQQEKKIGASPSPEVPAALERTSDLLHSKSALTLDDIRRIVAAEQAREHMPNAFKHQNPAQDMLDVPITTKVKRDSVEPANYFSSLSPEDHRLVAQIARTRLGDMICSRLMSEDELTALLSPPQQSIWAKMGKALGSNKPRRFGVFGIELETLIEKSGVDSTLGVGGYTLRIPSFLEEIINAMRQKDMGIEGVFRKNGNIKRIRDFQDIADKGVDIGSMLVDENVIQLAALFKTFLRNMPTPLLGNRIGRLYPLSTDVDPEQRDAYVRLLVCLLEPAYRDVLEVLMTFLNWCASFSSMDEEAGSKMDAHNLATVITPNILPSAKEGTQPDHFFQAIETTSLLIKNHTFAARIPPDVWDVFTKLKESSQKDKLSQREVTEFVRSFE